MIDGIDVSWTWMFTSGYALLSIVALVLAVVIVGKAIRGYRQNDDRAMLWLATGLFLLVLAPIPVELASTLAFEGVVEVQMAGDLLERLLRIAGLGCILASMYVTR